MIMKHRSDKPMASSSDTRVNDAFDFDTFLHPGRAFSHPMDVVRDGDLTLYEKRAILSSWASDACVIEAAPELRINASGNVVRWDDIMDALRTLDQEAATAKPPPHYKQVLARRSFHLPGARIRSRRASDPGQPLN